MATRAEIFRALQERAGPKREKRVQPGQRPVAGSARSESGHAGRKATYLLEDTAGRPSRKSSRKASNRQRTDGQFQAKRLVAEVRPHAPASSHR